jgi:small conductance mechanosensitive channel
MEEILKVKNIDQYIVLAEQFIIKYGVKLLMALSILFIGLWIIKKILYAINLIFEKRNFDTSLKGFLRSFIDIILKALLIITVLSTLGVEMTSFIAILGAAGFAIGMALSGTLSNFAGGVIILILKPFRVGDVIEAQGYVGNVKEIQIFNTTLNTFDNKRIIIPNGALATGNLTNYSIEDKRRVDWTFGIAYGDSYDKAKEIIFDLLIKNDKVLRDPEIFIALHSLGDSSVNITVRAWCNTPNYWEIYFRLNEEVYKSFSEQGINIPYPQMDIHIKKD